LLSKPGTVSRRRDCRKLDLYASTCRLKNQGFDKSSPEEFKAGKPQMEKLKSFNPIFWNSLPQQKGSNLMAASSFALNANVIPLMRTFIKIRVSL